MYGSYVNKVVASKRCLNWENQTMNFLLIHTVLWYKLCSFTHLASVGHCDAANSVTFTATDELVGGLKQACRVRLQPSAAVDITYRRIFLMHKKALVKKINKMWQLGSISILLLIQTEGKMSNSRHKHKSKVRF